MAFVKYIAPVVAAAGYAAAQSSCSVSATTTLQSAADATAISGCQTFTGSIALATGIAGSFALDGIQKIRGNLIGNNVTGLTAFSGDSLEVITDTFGLQSMIVMSSLNFPRLSAVKAIDWSALPALNGLSFATGVELAESVSIQNTQLGSLDGINLQEVNTMMLANNRYLREINMQLGNVSDSLTISANGRNVSAEFPNLIWAQNMTINNVSSLSLPSLETVNGSFGLNFNYFSTFSAANLTNVGGSLSFISNPEVTNISFPMLTEVQGGLQIANNSILNKITGFPELQTVGGAFDCLGNFTDIELNNLKMVSGAFTVKSTSSITEQCNKFENEAGPSNVIRGTFTCNGGDPSATGTVMGSGSGTSSGSSTTSSGAANTLVITGATGLLGVVAAIFGLL